MAHVIGTPARASFGHALANALQALRDGLRQYRTYRKTRNELLALSDHDLEDIGLNRSMIERVALDSAFGPTR